MSAEQQHPAREGGAGRDLTSATRPTGPARHGAWARDEIADDAAEAWADDDGAGGAWAPVRDDDAWATGDTDDAWGADGDAARGATGDAAWSADGGTDRGAGSDGPGQHGATPVAAAWDETVPVGSGWDAPVPAESAQHERRSGSADRRRSTGSRAAGPRTAPTTVVAGATDPVRALREALAARGLDAGTAAGAPQSAGRGTTTDPVGVGAPPGGLGTRPSGVAARSTGGARRAAGRGRRAPATEPPEDGPAAVDAEPDHESVARAIVLRQLTAAPRSRQQLAEALVRREVPEDVANRVLDRFTEVGLVDDAAYAEVLVRSRHAERGLSRRALALELRRRGVDDGIAREALAQVDDDDEEQAARVLARKKLAASRGLDRETRMRRAYGALGRRGYGGSLVARVVREELDAERAPTDDDGGFRRGGRFG